MRFGEHALRWAVGKLPPERLHWGEAMLAEAVAPDTRATRRWLAGCLVTVLRYAAPHHKRYLLSLALFPAGEAIALAFAEGIWPLVVMFVLAASAAELLNPDSDDGTISIVGNLFLGPSALVVAATDPGHWRLAAGVAAASIGLSIAAVVRWTRSS